VVGTTHGVHMEIFINCRGMMPNNFVGIKYTLLVTNLNISVDIRLW